MRICYCRCFVGKSKLDVELEEHGHQDGDDAIEHEGDLDDDVLDQLLLVSILCAKVVCIERPLDTLKPGIGHGDDNKVGDNEHIDEEQDEEFAVPEAYTVIDPRAMMVHIEHTSVAA